MSATVARSKNHASRLADGVSWHLAPELAAAESGAPAWTLTDWQSNGRARIIKQGPHRTVYRLDLPEQCLYVKHYRCAGLLGAARHMLRPSASRREWRRAVELERRRIPTVRPLAWGERRRGRLVFDNYFVSAGIERTCSLDVYAARHLAVMPRDQRARRRRQIIASLARLCAEMHDQGVRHNDLHAGNLLIRMAEAVGGRTTDEIELFVIDLPAIRLSRPLAWRASRASLAMLGGGLLDHTSRAERWRFFKAYLQARRTLVIDNVTAAAAQLEASCRRHIRRVIRSRDRRPLRTNRDFFNMTAGAARGWAVRDLPREQVAALLEDPEQLLRSFASQPVKLSHGSVVLQARMPSATETRAIAYKRYRPKNTLKWLQSFLRPARALAAWKTGHALLARGIATARPLAAIVRRTDPRRSSYLITEWIPSGLNVHLYLWQLRDTDPPSRRRRVRQTAVALGRLIARIHDWQVSHRDLKGCNLMVVEQVDAVQTLLIDLDGVRIRKSLCRRVRVENLARLAASMEAHDWITHADRLRFLRAYQRGLHGEREDWKALWRDVAAAADRVVARFGRRDRPVA